jgi:hypothetical protein
MIMSLFSNKDILTREIESWKGFEYALREEDRVLFVKMLNYCYKYSTAINAKGEPFSTEILLMTLSLSQQKLIDLLIGKLGPYSDKDNQPKKKQKKKIYNN